MPTYSSPTAGVIDAESIDQAAYLMMRRFAQATYGPGAIVREYEAGGNGAAGDGITARAYIGRPVHGDGRLDLHAIELYPVENTPAAARSASLREQNAARSS